MTILTIGNAKPPVPAQGAPYLTGAFTMNPTTDWDSWLVDSAPAPTDIWCTFVPTNGTFSTAISQYGEVTDRRPSMLHIAWSLPGTVDLAHIASGADDAYITSCAQQIASIGRPVFLRLNSEMQGDWTPYSAWDSNGVAKTGNTPSDYVAAWRRTATLVREVAPNAAFLWCPNLWGPAHASPAYVVADWYPGDDWVDWCAVDAYPGQSNWAFMRDEPAWGLAVARAHAAAHGKPFMIAEWGIGQVAGDDVIWINQMFDWAYAAKVQAMCYFSIDQFPIDGGHDFRLQTWPNSRDVFRARAARA